MTLFSLSQYVVPNENGWWSGGTYPTGSPGAGYEYLASTEVQLAKAQLTFNGPEQSYGVLCRRADPAQREPHPIVLVHRGGGSGVNSQLDDTRIVEIFARIASWDPAEELNDSNYPGGYFVACPDFKAGDGDWNGKTTSDGTDDLGGLEDQEVALGWLAATAEVGKAAAAKADADPGRLALYGLSAGTLRVLGTLRAGVVPRIVILQAGVYNLRDTGSHTSGITSLLGQYSNRDPNDLDTLDDISWAHSEVLRSLPREPIYVLIHAENDTTAPVRWFRQFARDGAAAGLKIRAYEIPNDTHTFGNQPDAVWRILRTELREAFYRG